MKVPASLSGNGAFLLLLLGSLSLSSATPLLEKLIEPRTLRVNMWVSGVHSVSGDISQLLNQHQAAVCPGPLPGPPYPPVLEPLRPRLNERSGRVTLEFRDHHGHFDVLENREALCDAAGCHCRGASLTCGHTEGFFYEPLFARVYANMCFHVCHCDLLPPPEDYGVLSRLHIAASGRHS
ncbi:hypothetical protein XPA_002244 [Xanthoria parietina]